MLTRFTRWRFVAGMFLLALGSAACSDDDTKPATRPEGETNVAQIRTLALSARPGSEPTALPADIRALSLRGIVVSDREGGNLQPFLVAVADATDRPGAGLTLSIAAEANTFSPGDVIAVALNDATAQLFNGLLQIATNNRPEVVGRRDPLKPIPIEAARIADYASQYVVIEKTQPQAGESGTWYDGSNKGNVSMETPAGIAYKMRTLSTAAFASEAVPADKSGSAAGLAGVYGSTLQLMPQRAADILLTDARFTIEVTDATLAEVLAGPAGAAYRVEGATVVGANLQGVMLRQDEALMYAFPGSENDLTTGDIVTVTGQTEERNGLLQFGKGCTVVRTGHTDDVTLPAPETFDAAKIEAYMDAPRIVYATYTGTVLIVGNYVNVEIDGTSVQGSLDYMSEEFKTKYDNHVLKITGWLFGSFKNYLYTLPVAVQDLGEYVEPVPEGAIFYNTFDKQLSSETFGDGSQWPFLDQFDGWINQKGSGIADLAYDFEHMSVRSNQSSKGDLSLYDGSGRNNIFFSTAPNHFTIAGIAVPSEKLRLTFGAQRYSQGASNTFIKSEFDVRLSADGELWSQRLDYGFGDVEDIPGDWRLATADFTLPAGTTTLYIRFEAKMSSANRIDDVLLVAGQGGQQIVFGAEEVVPLSTVAEVLAAPVDEIYKVEGQVVATHSKGCLVQDATGTILVFKKNMSFVAGDLVTVEGPTTEYGGMKQFGETSEVVKTGYKEFTLPEPVDFEAAQFDAYVGSPVIRYIRYRGNLTMETDKNYQKHYNVAVEGTPVIGSVAYPNSSLNISAYLKRDVIITGYAVGVTGSEVKYLNTMATSIEFAEQEPMPDIATALTVRQLNERLASMSAGDPLETLVAFKGYVAANNQGGNLFEMLSIVDNTGEAHTGILLKGLDYTDADMPVGSEVVVSLRYAEYDLYQGLPQIKSATVFRTGRTVAMNVPRIAAAQAPDFLGQYATVVGLTPATTATTWVVDGKTTTTAFTGADGATVIARVTKYAEFRDERIVQREADLSGVIEVYKMDYQIYPTGFADVAGFKE